MSPITRSITSLHRICNPNFPTYRDLDDAYNFSVPFIEDDAKKYLQRILDTDEMRELYNPISEEYWIVNNVDALNQVVYYKMKRSLFRKYKQQFINAGIELEFLKCQKSEIGCDIFCSNYISKQNSTVSNLSNLSSFYYDSSDDTNNHNNLNNLYKIKIRVKKDESSQTVLGDYVERPHRRHLQYSQYSQYPNYSNHLNHGAVKSQVKEFIESEMSRIAAGDISSNQNYLSNSIDEKNGLAGLVRKQLNEVLHDQLSKMMDGISTDYALYSGGARIIPHITSRGYEEWPSKGYQKLWGMLTHRNVIKSNNAEVVISPNVNVGECWCFNATRGQIAIRLSRSIVITHITYTHIGKEVAIDPINFNLFLGKYEYDLEKRPTQSFQIPENHRIRAILMKILNNHENPKFTCLYRLQVHGDLPL
ncbi:5752_t:CDS:2 [Diversispora eburnea]|uniref:5752_t:CDS:1 n=1 Tax=Diversispora eburnea TaxID=1213867 RepID=A0A9N8UY73_9GLOM|nr:5752_t:CDS:2 [Diversispora eburnea]